MRRILAFVTVIALMFGFALVSDGAVTTSITKKTTYIPEWIVYRVDVTFDASYDTLGETLSLGGYLPKIEAIWLSSSMTDPGGHIVTLVDSTWSSGTAKAKVYAVSGDTLLEVASSTNLSDEKITLFIAGKK